MPSDPARRLALALLLAVALAAGCNIHRDQRRFASTERSHDEPIVQLRCGHIPRIGWAAVHCWFAVYDPTEDRWQRWEIWQSAREGDGYWGHLRRDKGDPGDWWLGSHWTHHEWRGEDARRLLTVIARTPQDYPHTQLYRYWPGPNSNTYPAWVLRQAGVSGDLPARAVGKDYFALLGGAGITPSRTGVQLETLPLGIAIGLRDGVEVHLLGLTFGVDIWPPALDSPLGRLGFPESCPTLSDHSTRPREHHLPTR